MIKGSLAWKEITMSIITLFLFPILTWGFGQLYAKSEKTAEELAEAKRDIAVTKTQQLYNDKQFDTINAKLNILVERRK